MTMMMRGSQKDAPVILPESSCHLTGEVWKRVCQAEASPKASIHWTVDGNDTLPSSFVASTNKKNVVSGEVSVPAQSQSSIYFKAANSLGSNTKQLPIDFSTASSLALLGVGLLFGCVMLIYRKCSRNRVIMPSVVECEVILSVYIISFIVGLPANLLAVYAFSVKIRSRPLPTDILLLNLTVSDLLFLIILPLKMHEAASGMEWHLSSSLCSITSFIFFSTIYTSSLLLMAVSVVRYIGVAFPITYHRLLKPVYAIVISAVIWLISAAHCSIVFITEHHPSLSSSNSSICYENFTKKQLEVLLPVRLEFFFVLCLVPLLICVYCYLRCILILYSRPRISWMQKQKAIGMALGSLAVFLICVLPFNFSHLLGYFLGESPQWRYYTLLLSTFNTCIDPIIFYFSSSSFHCNSKKSIFRKQVFTVSSLQRQPTSSS